MAVSTKMAVSHLHTCFLLLISFSHCFIWFKSVNSFHPVCHRCGFVSTPDTSSNLYPVTEGCCISQWIYSSRTYMQKWAERHYIHMRFILYYMLHFVKNAHEGEKTVHVSNIWTFINNLANKEDHKITFELNNCDFTTNKNWNRIEHFSTVSLWRTTRF
jgi:hypothetical protein